ncbi:MAG: hypothetical protein LBR65_04190 [Culturomica sp.]|jgi:hypothetical protein|nr:hypothetical protein [Culturomica sp.]
MKCGAEYCKTEKTKSVTSRFTTFGQIDYKAVKSKIRIPVFSVLQGSLSWDRRTSRGHPRAKKESIRIIANQFFTVFWGRQAKNSVFEATTRFLLHTLQRFQNLFVTYSKFVHNTVAGLIGAVLGLIIALLLPFMTFIPIPVPAAVGKECCPLQQTIYASANLVSTMP